MEMLLAGSQVVDLEDCLTLVSSEMSALSCLRRSLTFSYNTLVTLLINGILTLF